MEVVIVFEARLYPRNLGVPLRQISCREPTRSNCCDKPALQRQFDAWKAANPALLTNQCAVLDFMFANYARYAEPEWRRYPVLSLF